MIFYKIDVLETLKEAGYTPTGIRKERLISEGTLQRLREGRPVSFDTLDRICELTGLEISDVIGRIGKKK